MWKVNIFVSSFNKKYNFVMKKEFQLYLEDINSQIKFLASTKGYKLWQLKEKINSVYGKTDKINNLSGKIRTKTLRVSELAEIAEVLGYEIILREK